MTDTVGAEKQLDPVWAWAPYEPDARRPWDLRWAGHLYRRAGFGATWEQLQQALKKGPQRTIDTLLRPEADLAAFNRTYEQYEEAAAGSIDSLRAWWLRRMIVTPHPLLEKMTLFWHGHFALSSAKVGSPLLMQRHVQLLRRGALGRFEPLLKAVARDPATLIWLDANDNRKARLDEQYARAILETFTLGPDKFSPQDVREAARALSGWSVFQNEFRFVEREHDAGVKQVLGQQGNFGGDDLLGIALEQPATARSLVRKLYRWLISETDVPDDGLIAPLAAPFAKDYDVLKLVETMLRSNWFFSLSAYRRRIKSPVEFAVGIVRPLEELVPTVHLGRDLAALGQNLYQPPSIRGWPGGRMWINKATVLGRSNLALALLAGAGAYGDKIDPAAVARRHGSATPQAAGRFLLDLFLQGDVAAKVAEGLLQMAAAPAESDAPRRLRQLAHGVVTLPEFQLA